MTTNPLLHRQREKVSALRRDLEIGEAVLAAMEELAASFGESVDRSTRVEQPIRSFRSLARPRAPERRGGGKQPGTLTMRWQKVLHELYNQQEWFNIPFAVEAVEIIDGRQVRPTEVRRLFKGYVELEFLTVRPDGYYKVTEQAAERFGFTKNQGSSLSENDRPATLDGLLGASEAGGEGTSTPQTSHGLNLSHGPVA